MESSTTRLCSAVARSASAWRSGQKQAMSPAEYDGSLRHAAPWIFAGLAAGVASERYIETLLYQVKGTDMTMLALPALTSSRQPYWPRYPRIRAVRIDPA